LAFCVAFGVGVEWSFACPGIGIEFDCCVLLMSEVAAEVAAGACAAGVEETASEQLTKNAAARTIAAIGPC